MRILNDWLRGAGAWNHLQLTIDTKTNATHVRIQVIGEAPKQLCQTTLHQPPAIHTPLSLELLW